MSWIGKPRGIRASESCAMTFLVGFGMHGCIVVAFGLLGLFFPVVARTRVILFAILGAWTMRGWFRVRPEGPVSTEARWFKRTAVAFFVFLALFSLTPETWIDSLAYHLAAPQDFNKLHKWVDIHQDMYRYPLLPEGIYGQAMVFGGERLGMLLNLSGTLLTLWLLWAWAGRLAGPSAAWLAVLALLSSDQVGFHIGQTNQGMYSVGFALLGVWAWMLTVHSASSKRCAFVAGLGMGWALCSKYTAAAPVAGIVFWHLWRLPHRPRKEVSMLAFLVLGMAASSAPFLLNGWFFTGNPVYPLFFGGLDWTDENTKMLNLFGCVGYDFKLDNIVALSRSMLRLVTEEQPLFLLALPAVLAMRSRYWTPFAVAWLGAFVAWSIGVPCLRLMMPMYPALSLLSAVAIASWLDAKREGPVRVTALLSTFLMLWLGFAETIAATDTSKRSFMAAVGLETECHYLARILTTYDEATREVNRLVPPAERVLLVGDPRGYRFRPLVFNRDIEDTPVMLELAREAGTADDMRRRLRQMGVRYVLLNYVTSEYLSSFTNQVFRWRPLELKAAWEYWRRYATIVWTSPNPDGIQGGFMLYRLNDEPGPPTPLIPFLPGAESVGVRRSLEDSRFYVGRLKIVEDFAPGVVYFDVRLATGLLAVGRAREALRLATRDLDSAYPEKECLYGLQGIALQRMRRFKEAAEAFRRAESLKPTERGFSRLREECERAVAQGKR